MPHKLVELTVQQLNQLPRSSTVFFFPVGAIEDHGPHLPMGLDLFESERLCTLTAESVEKQLPGWVSVLMPPAPLGVSGNTSSHVVLVRAHVLRDWLVDSCRCLKRQGFRHFVCFSGSFTPKQLTAIEDAGKKINRSSFWLRGFGMLGGSRARVTLVSASSVLVPVEEIKRSLFWAHPSEHGGKRDTSVALFLAENQVAPTFSQLPKVATLGPSVGYGIKRVLRKSSGYWGDPASGSARVGEQVLKASIQDVFPKLRAVWEGSNPNFIFRSWYSIIPWNKSFFGAWVLSLILFLIIASWSVWWIQPAALN